MAVPLATAGCAGTSPSDNTARTTEENGNDGPTVVAAGPDGDPRFEPTELEIPVGETVKWTFESPGHNVSSKPGAHSDCQNPDGAKPFASYGDGNHAQVVPKGESYEHTFRTAGEFIYVCVPHANLGMIGTVVVKS